MAAYGRGKVAHRWTEHIAGIVAGRDCARFEEILTHPDGSTTRSHNGCDKGHLRRTDMNSGRIFVLDAPYGELDPKRSSLTIPPSWT